MMDGRDSPVSMRSMNDIAPERLPAGTVTFVLGDVVGSTAMWAHDSSAAAETIAALDGLVRKLVYAHDGACPVEQGEGDSFVAAFERAADAVAFACALQLSVSSSEWPGDDRPFLRLGIHTGDARLQDGLYRGDTLNRCARIRALAHGDQILVSGATAELVVDHLSDGTFLKDVGTHRLRDLSRPESLRQVCCPGLPFDFPALRSLDRLPNNLPIQLTSFLGRDAEMEELTALLDAQRLVTLTGAGGSGKTRLALQVAAATLDRYPDGTWFVDLAPLPDGALVARAVADTVRVHEMPLEDVTSALVRHFEELHALIVLDNCEHLIDECARLSARLVTSCAHLSVLTTSREPLGVAGEHAYRVASLAIPDGTSVDCASVDLFVDRASAVRRDFALTADNIDAVAAVCRRLDGLPLAIELAAARCRSMDPAQIAEQLAERFSLLSGGARTAVARQRTLEASVGWSLDLLSDDERSLLHRLAVFAGDFSLDAAEAVSGFDSSDRWRVIDVVTSLIDKSLVQLDAAEGASRYRLLETVRHIAGERLSDAGDAEAARDAHADHFIKVVQSLSKGLTGDGTIAAARQLDHELDNIRAALAWLVRRGDADRALALTVPLHVHWSRNASTDVLTQLEQVLELPGGDPAQRARVLITAAEVAWMLGDGARNETYLDAMDAYLREHDDAELALFATLYRGYRNMVLDDGDADGYLAEAEQGFRARGDLYWSSDASFGRALLAWWAGAMDDADAFARAAMVDARQSRNDIAIARALAIHGGIIYERGDHATAARIVDEAAALVADAPDAAVSPMLRGVRSLLLAAAGRLEDASAEATKAIDEAIRGGLATMLCQPMWSAAVTAHWATSACAGALIAEATETMEVFRMGWGSAAGRALAAEVACGDRRLDDARRLLDEAFAIVDENEAAGLAHSTCLLARARVARYEGGDGEGAARDALQVAIGQGVRLQAIEACEVLAACAADTGRFDDAGRLLGAAARARADTGIVVPPVYALPLDETRTTVLEAVGPDAFERLLAQGASLDLPGAYEYVQRGRERTKATVGWDSLTPMERRVVDLVAQGLKNADVAQQLFVSVPTVKTHLAHVFSKLGVSTRAELAAAATRHASEAASSPQARSRSDDRRETERLD